MSNNTSSSLHAAFERIAEVIRIYYLEIAKNYDLSVLQLQILFYLSKQKENPLLRTLSSIAQYFGVTLPTVSDSVRVLKEKNLIVAIPKREDRRTQILQLTSEADALLQEVPMLSEVTEELFNAYGGEDQVLLYELMLRWIDLAYQKGFIPMQQMCFRCAFYSKKNSHHYCNLLKKQLDSLELRIHCEDFQPVA